MFRMFETTNFKWNRAENSHKLFAKGGQTDTQEHIWSEHDRIIVISIEAKNKHKSVISVHSVCLNCKSSAGLETALTTF